MKQIFSLTLLLVSIFIINTLHNAGLFKTIVPHSELSNHTIYDSVAGTEDLEIDRLNGRLFISSSDRWGKDPSKDGVYLLDLNTGSQPFKLKSDYSGEFHPHGMSFFSKEGSDYLFVINHNDDGDFVELFSFNNMRLTHLKSFKNEDMCCPNDLVAVDIDKFYVSNDHGSKKGITRLFEDYLGFENAYILYFNGNNYTRVYENLSYANGITASDDGLSIYVTETNGGKLSVLSRNIQSGNLTLRYTKKLDTGLDNITVDSNGNLWLAAHPKLLDFVAHAKNNGSLSPSQVLRLAPDGGDNFSVSEVYSNTGEEISGSSTALYYRGKVYIGVVFERKLLSGIF